ncbi:MAG: hypothetical protein K2Y27_34290, partial [Xanthobacteraceae bacterium]|nr:hypothetical protein [Xanthobacteraceae bacterium]
AWQPKPGRDSTYRSGKSVQTTGTTSDLHHHHLHRDGDPLLVTQHVDGVIYGVALATHETYFRKDCMGWLKDHIDAFDWTGLESLRAKVANYDPFGPDADDDEGKRKPF